MLHKRLKSEGGFTLIELLVVILIIGILAAIALPTFLNQRQKGQDAEAKSNARNAVSQVESCAADQGGNYQTPTNCNTSLANSGLPATATAGAAPAASSGQVSVTAVNGVNGYTVTASSKSGRTYTYQKNGGTVTRQCTGTPACQSATW